MLDLFIPSSCALQVLGGDTINVRSIKRISFGSMFQDVIEICSSRPVKYCTMNRKLQDLVNHNASFSLTHCHQSTYAKAPLQDDPNYPAPPLPLVFLFRPLDAPRPYTAS